jgi:hypothetical protein
MNIIEDNKNKIENYKLNPPNPSYIAGFIDGDGCIYIRKIKDGYNSGIIITQSRTNILQILKYHYGGKIIKPSKILTENKFNQDGFYDINNRRNSYNLVINSIDYIFLINDIKDHIILKEKQINALYNFSKIVNKQNLNNEKEELFNLCSYNNKNKLQNEYIFSKICIEYIQGLFDAEGYIFVSYKKENNEIKFTKGVYLKITQKNHPQVIIEIQKFLGFGKVSDYCYYLDNFEDCLRFVKLVKCGVIVKYKQICAFEEYLLSRLEKNDKYNNEIHLKRYNLYKIINMEKHQIEVYDENDYILNDSFYKEKCKNKKLLDKELLDIENNITEETKKQNLKQIQSEKKTGINNPNYGHNLTDTHALNISLSTTVSKRSKNENLTNEKIREIYGLKDIELQKNVAEKYNMNREIVRRIWNKIILPTDDPEFLQSKIEKTSTLKKEEIQNNNLTFEQKTSIGKRTLSIDEYIIILEWRIKYNNKELLEGKKISTPKLAEYLSKTLNKKITSDIIKNIWCGKTKIFDFEFIGKSISYEDYIKLTNKNSE